MTDQPDPLAPFRALADRYAARAAESLRNAEASTIIDEASLVQQGIAAGWQGAEFVLRHTLADLDNSRTTPNNPPASDDTRRRALAHNAVATALNAHGEWLPLSVREAVADAVLAAAADMVLDQRLNDARSQPVQDVTDERRALYARTLREHGMAHLGDQAPADEYDCCADAVLAVRDQELERQRARIVTLEHVAKGNKRHVQLIVPDLERAEAAVARVRAIHTPVDTMAGRVCEGCMNCDPYEALPWPCRTIEALDGEETPS